MSRVHLPGLVLGSWTLLLWSTRVNNVLDDTALTGWSRTWQLGAAIGFVIAGIVLVVSSAGRRNPFAEVVSRRLGLGLAVFGSLWWLVRGTGTLLADHSVGFKVVHTLLAVGTIAIGGWLISGDRHVDRSARTAKPELA